MLPHRECGMTYSQLAHGLKKAQIEIDRKVPIDIAVHDMEAFKGIMSKESKADRPEPAYFWLIQVS